MSYRLDSRSPVSEIGSSQFRSRACRSWNPTPTQSSSPRKRCRNLNHAWMLGMDAKMGAVWLARSSIPLHQGNSPRGDVHTGMWLFQGTIGAHCTSGVNENVPVQTWRPVYFRPTRTAGFLSYNVWGVWRANDLAVKFPRKIIISFPGRRDYPTYTDTQETTHPSLGSDCSPLSEASHVYTPITPLSVLI
jgi:hypothetical protein